MQNEKGPGNILLYIFFVIYLLCCVGACCLAAITIFSISSSQPSLEFPLAQPLDENCTEADCLKACIYELPDIHSSVADFSSEINKLTDYIEIARYKEGETSGTIVKTRSPIVPEYLQPYQQDLELHRKIWQYYQEVFPADMFTEVDYMIIYTDGTSGGTAAQIWNVGGTWQLYVDILDFEQPYATESLIHEYGHAITLNDLQVSGVDWSYSNGITEKDFSKMEGLCNTFFDGSDCANSNSYLNHFGELFWKDIYPEWREIYIQHGNDEDDFDKAIEKFYMDHSDQFITSYAPTNPREDIAESWTEFVMSPKPTGSTIADQKVLFFYQFPELVETRTTIIQKTCQFAIEYQQP